jgi:hypothetical protein
VHQWRRGLGRRPSSRVQDVGRVSVRAAHIAHNRNVFVRNRNHRPIQEETLG